MRNLSRIALIVLIVGALLILTAPFLFTLNGWLSFTNTGQIGDTIGGITAPITGLIGSILVFLALRAQIVANEIIQGQIQDQRDDDRIKKEVTYISDLYKYFLKSIDDFEYDKANGKAAVLKLLHDVAIWPRKNAHQESFYFGKVAEYFSILTFIKLLIEKINNSKVDDQDKNLFKELIRHHVETIILPVFSSPGHKDPCAICGEDHNGIPFQYREIVDKIMKSL